jgi:hypothetical protein
MNDYACKKMNPETQLNWNKMFKAPVIAIALLSNASVTACTSVNQDEIEEPSQFELLNGASDIEIGMNRLEVYDLMANGVDVGRRGLGAPWCENFSFSTPGGERYTRVYYDLGNRVERVSFNHKEPCYIE